jgi:hypothetical protein
MPDAVSPQPPQCYIQGCTVRHWLLGQLAALLWLLRSGARLVGLPSTAVQRP